MSPAFRAAIISLAIALASSCGSCRSQSVLDFQWKDAGGEAIAFSQSPQAKSGEEGRLGPSLRAIRLAPAKELRLEAGSSLVLEIRCGIEGQAAQPDVRAAISVSASLAAPAPAAGPSPAASATFPLFPGDQWLVLPIDSGIRVEALSVAAQGTNPSFRLMAIESAPYFKGIERGPKGPRVSGAFTLTQASGRQELSIARPFEGLRDGDYAGLVLQYDAAPRAASLGLEVTLPGGATRDLILRSHPRGMRTVLDQSLVPADTEVLNLDLPEGIELESFFASRLSPKDYGLADLGRAILAPAPNSDYSLFEWDLLPSVLVFDFKDYATQARYLSRLAFYAEKAGYRGRLVGDEVIATQHGWNAHDYGALDLAAFFQAARRSSFPLGPQEKGLENILLQAGIITESKDGIKAGKGAIISISRESSDSLRRTFAVHESTHAIFFVDPEYRSFARSLWASVGPEERWFWKAYLGWAGYDTSSDYLMANEFQAYLLQQPVAAAQEYFAQRKAAELLDKHPELKDRVASYMASYGSSFAKRAKQLEDWLGERYGIQAGSTIFISRR